MKELRRGGVTIAYEDRGPRGAPAVVLLHGLAGWSGEWGDTAASLSTTHRVIAPDQRGHGRSTQSPSDVSRAAFVGDVVALVADLDLGPVTLVGHSLGGHTAMLVAARHPDLVGRLVVAETSPAPDPEGPVRVGAWLEAWPVPFPTRAEATDYFVGLPYFCSRHAAEMWAAGLAVTSDGFRPPFDPRVMVDALGEIATTDYWSDWSGIRCPTLVVRGEHGAVSREVAEAMAGRLERARLAEVPGAGHDVHLDQPERWRDLIEEFLSPG